MISEMVGPAYDYLTKFLKLQFPFEKHTAQIWKMQDLLLKKRIHGFPNIVHKTLILSIKVNSNCLAMITVAIKSSKLETV